MKTCLLLIVLVGYRCSWAFDSCSTDTCKDSCRNRCGKKLDKSFNCQCNNQCERFGDCCGDYNKCLYIEPSSESGHDHYSKPSDVADKKSCSGRCDEAYNKNNPCHCNRKCSKFNNCCDDHSNLCKRTDSTSTHGQDAGKNIEPSSESGHDHYSKPSDVADADIEPSQESGQDHYSKPLEVADKKSCRGRCDDAYNKKNPCNCNRKCSKFNNCCDDYSNLCKRTDTPSTHGQGTVKTAADDSVKGDISQKELEEVSESLYKADVNRAQDGDVILNKQHFASNSREQEDQSDHPLYSYVNEEIFSKPTYAAFLCLLDNYDRQTGTAEDAHHEKIGEQDLFLQEIMKTDVMQKLYTFFHKKELYASKEEFVKDLKNMWFGLYSRGKGEMDSSGFEHVFVGEVKKGKVSGFHNWIRFYLLEKQGMVDYYCHVYDGPWETFPDVIGKQFQWDGCVKEVGSSFIGSSPEFDFSIYSLCFIARPGRACKVSLGGHPLKIQTYTWTKCTYGNGRNYIATAYPVT